MLKKIVLYGTLLSIPCHFVGMEKRVFKSTYTIEIAEKSPEEYAKKQARLEAILGEVQKRQPTNISWMVEKDPSQQKTVYSIIIQAKERGSFCLSEHDYLQSVDESPRQKDRCLIL